MESSRVSVEAFSSTVLIHGQLLPLLLFRSKLLQKLNFSYSHRVDYFCNVVTNIKRLNMSASYWPDNLTVTPVVLTFDLWYDALSCVLKTTSIKLHSLENLPNNLSSDNQLKSNA